jgi:hypothetical protein
MEQLQSMLSLSGRMNRRSFFINLLIVFCIGFVGGFIMGFSGYSMLSILIGAPFILIAIVREVAIAARRIHDLNGPTFLAFIYIVLGILAVWSSEIGWLVLVSKILLCLIPGNKETNSYGDKPEDKIVI